MNAPGAVQAAYGQLLGLGLLWVSFHCAGMCGTLLINMDVPGRARGQGALRGAASVLSYQGGRALTYAWLGGLAGLLGAGLGRRFQDAGAAVAVVLGVGALLLGARGLWRALRPAAGAPRLVRLGGTSPPRGLQARLGALAGSAAAALLGGGAGPLRELLLGALMGFLPCMIAVWALGLAALTGSPLHGAAIMLLLVLMTTPTLLGVTLLPRLVPLPAALRQRLGALLPPLLLGASGAQMLLIGAAALGLLPHAHLGLDLFGRGFLVMLY